MNTDKDNIPHCARYDSIDAIIIGAGRGGIALIHTFEQYDFLHLNGVVDIDSEAVGMAIARNLNIPTYSDIETALPGFKGDMIIDVTGNSEVRSRLLELRENPGIEIVSGKTAKLLFNLAEDQISDKKKIESKTMQLELFKTMLNISKHLETGENQKFLLDRRVESSEQLIIAHKAIVLDCIDTSKCQIVGGVGFDNFPDFVDKEIVDKLMDIVHKNTEKFCVEVPGSISVPGISGAFQLAIPIFIDGELCYFLLFQVQLPVHDEIRPILESLVSHLEFTLKVYRRHKSLKELVYRDHLTGLYNRRYFDERLKEELARLRRCRGGNLAVMFLDLDNFKILNDTLGHAIGDKTLEKVAGDIYKKFRTYDVVARYGGDEFVSILIDVQEEALDIISQRVLSTMKDFQVPGAETQPLSKKLGISIGVCMVRPESDADVAVLLDHADKALYTVKRNGGGHAHSVIYE